MMKKYMSLWMVLLTSVALASCQTELTSSPNLMPPEVIEVHPTILDDNDYDRLFLRLSKKTLTIEVKEEDYSKLNETMHDYYDMFGSFKDDTYIQANVIYEDDLGIIKMKDVGFRSRGNLSRAPLLDELGNIIVNHYKLKFNVSFEGTIRNEFLFGLEELDLKYNRNYDETYMNELGSLQLYEAFDVYAQKATLMHVLLKVGEQLHAIGIMTAFEPIDEWFIHRRFHMTDEVGDLYKVLWQNSGPSTLSPLSEGMYGIKDVSKNFRPGYDLKTNKDTSKHEALNLLIDALNHPNNHYVNEFIRTYFDLNYLARYFAVSLALGNPDDFRSMGNNYYVYFDPTLEKYYIMPYDLDHSLGQGWGGEPIFQDQLVDTNIYHKDELLEYLSGRAMEHPLTEHLFGMDAFLLLYENALLEVVQAPIFTMTYFKGQIDLYQSFYEQEVSISMINAPFGYRNLSWFLEGKKDSVLSQLSA
jgi:spore coat protein H